MLRQTAQDLAQGMAVCMFPTNFLLSFSTNCLLRERWALYMYAGPVRLPALVVLHYLLVLLSLLLLNLSSLIEFI